MILKNQFIVTMYRIVIKLYTTGFLMKLSTIWYKIVDIHGLFSEIQVKI